MKNIVKKISVTTCLLTIVFSIQASAFTCAELVNNNWYGSGHDTAYGNQNVTFHVQIPSITTNNNNPALISVFAYHSGFSIGLYGKCINNGGIPSINLHGEDSYNNITVTLYSPNRAKISGTIYTGPFDQSSYIFGEITH